MNQITQFKSRGVRSLRNQSRIENDIPLDRLQWSINFSYNCKNQWFEYLHIYLDLFTDEKSAEIKAKTHSVAVMCILLIDRRRCSFEKIYKALLNEAEYSNMPLNQEILNLEDKWSFIDSLYVSKINEF